MAAMKRSSSCWCCDSRFIVARPHGRLTVTRTLACRPEQFWRSLLKPLLLRWHLDQGCCVYILLLDIVLDIEINPRQSAGQLVLGLQGVAVQNEFRPIERLALIRGLDK